MIPNMPQPSSQAMNKDLTMNDIWFLFFSQLIIELQGTLSPTGLKIPTADSATIALLNNENTLNTLIINSDTSQLLVNLTGTYQVVQVV